MRALPLHTRDGAVSTAHLIERMLDGSDDEPEDTGTRLVVDLATAVAWARQNGIKPEHGTLGRINAARAAAGLPLFDVVKPAAPVRPARPEARSMQDTPAVPALAAEAPSITPQPAQAPRLLVGSQEELLRLTTEHSGTVTGVVTPEIATWFMALNTGNRPLDSARVDRFVRLLADGGWINTGEPAVMSAQGVLNDGQHRFAAIIKAGIAAELDVRFGIAREAFAATNTGGRRTLGNVLAIEGHRHPTLTAAIARLIYFYDTRQMTRLTNQVEPDLLLRIVADNPRIHEVASKVSGHMQTPMARHAPFGLVLAVAARTWPLTEVFEFARLVNTGLGDDPNNAARRLYLRFTETAGKRLRLPALEHAALTVKAFNAWTEKRPVHFLKVFDTERTSEGFPQVLAA